MAANAPLRPAQSLSRSSAVVATRSCWACAARQMASIRSRSSSSPSRTPSTSTRRIPPASSGYPAPTDASTAWVDSWSIISIALGTIPAPMIADTVFEASSIVGNAAMSVRLSSGRGVSFTVISVTMPSVPSEPTKVPTRS